MLEVEQLLPTLYMGGEGGVQISTGKRVFSDGERGVFKLQLENVVFKTKI